MISFFLRCIIVIVSSLLQMGIAHALEPGEGIVLDPVTGDYKLTYMDELSDGTKVLSHATFVPATKIAPVIDSKFQLGHVDSISYSYSISNGAQSSQILDHVSFDIVGRVVGSRDLPDLQTITQAQVNSVLEANKDALITPTGWRSEISTYENGASISWDPVTSGKGIQAMGRVKGFGFFSQSLPGLGVAKFMGARKFANGYGGEGPDLDSDIGRQIQALDDNDFVPRNAAVPTIAVPVPFDAAVLLDRIRGQLATWPGKQLADPAYAAQLDRYLVAAADAYRLNNSKAGKEQIETIRKMLEQEHRFLDHDDEDNDDTPEHKTATRLTIDRLAARVLDFDLRYVLERAGKGAEHDADEKKKR